jgi:hypothetical protein
MDKDEILKKLMESNKQSVRRCVYCRPKHLMDNAGNPIEGDATDKASFDSATKYTDSFCNRWKPDSHTRYGVSPVDPKDPNCSWFNEEI